MIHPETILRDTAFVLPLMVVVGGLLEGWWGVLGVVATGVLVLGNLWVLGRITRHLTASMAGDESASGNMAVVVLLLKFPLFLGLAAGLVWLFGGISVGVALSSLVFAVFIRGVILLFSTAPEPLFDAPVADADELAQRS